MHRKSFTYLYLYRYVSTWNKKLIREKIVLVFNKWKFVKIESHRNNWSALAHETGILAESVCCISSCDKSSVTS